MIDGAASSQRESGELGRVRNGARGGIRRPSVFTGPTEPQARPV
jgi:hypothetical protein